MFDMDLFAEEKKEDKYMYKEERIWIKMSHNLFDPVTLKKCSLTFTVKTSWLNPG